MKVAHRTAVGAVCLALTCAAWLAAGAGATATHVIDLDQAELAVEQHVALPFRAANGWTRTVKATCWRQGDHSAICRFTVFSVPPGHDGETQGMCSGRARVTLSRAKLIVRRSSEHLHCLQ